MDGERFAAIRSDLVSATAVGSSSCSSSSQLPTLVEETELEKRQFLRAVEPSSSSSSHDEPAATSSPDGRRKPIAPTASISEDEVDEPESEEEPVSLRGLLYKWTNYLHGWQPRYFVLIEGTLSYYKSEYDASFACRGSAAVTKARVEMNDNDDCRFDVAVNDNVWYLRAETSRERQVWTDSLELFKTDSGFGSQGDLRRHGSLVSIASVRSLQSTSSFKKTQGLREKLAELETFRDIVTRQVDSLQSYFDACALNASSKNSIDDKQDYEDRSKDLAAEGGDIGAMLTSQRALSNLMGNGGAGMFAASDPLSLDFKGEALTFKATTTAILTTVEHCLELMQQREEAWRRRVDKEVDRRKKVEELCKQRGEEIRRLHDEAKASAVHHHPPAAAGPDFAEGPHSTLNEEEWYDAVDAALDREDLENDRIERLLKSRGTTWGADVKGYSGFTMPKHHKLYSEVDRLTLEQLRYAKAGVAEGVWELFAEDGEMRMYKREQEIDGMIVDPLKATHTVKGVTAFEYLHCFYESAYKIEWDTTLEYVNVIDKVSEDTMILHQVHKRVWPANQRDSLFWSHFRKVDSLRDPDAHDCYIVCNKDTERHDVQPPKGCLRLGLTIAMVCQTVITNQSKKHRQRCPSELTRDDISCRIIYVAQVNPGGWAPSSVLRIVYKKEYPKFLKRFTHFVLQKAENKPVMWG